MQLNTTKKIFHNSFSSIVLGLLALFAFPSIASAQAYVPVFDVELNPAFSQFSANFDTFAEDMNQALTDAPDSLRDIISGPNPQGVAIELCAVGTKGDVQIYDDGPWATAVASSSNALPSAPTNPEVNTSGSLRCLLQEMVEWQKLGLSLQIHQLLKQYIADAQAKQLNNQLMNKIASANLNWAKGGNEVDNNGIIYNEPVYVTNGSQSIYAVKERQLSHVTDQASADPASGNAVGSLGICEPWRLDATADMARNNRSEIEDPMNYTNQYTSCKIDTVLDPQDWNTFSESFNDPANRQGGMVTFLNGLSNKSDTPLGATTLTTDIARDRLARQEKSTEREYSNTGSRPTKTCSGRADDPYCLDEQNSTASTPGYQNQQNVSEVAQQGNKQVQDNAILDGTGGDEAQQQSTALNTAPEGLLGFDSAPLSESGTSVNRLVEEFWDAIEYGYFGISVGTTEWAQATMAQIYDEMKFEDGSTQIIVTNGAAPDPTGYGI